MTKDIHNVKKDCSRCQHEVIAPHPLTQGYSPGCHVCATGIGKLNFVTLNNLARRHLLCASLIFSLIRSWVGATPLKTTCAASEIPLKQTSSNSP
jgi:hypothetical protein